MLTQECLPNRWRTAGSLCRIRDTSEYYFLHFPFTFNIASGSTVQVLQVVCKDCPSEPGPLAHTSLSHHAKATPVILTLESPWPMPALVPAVLPKAPQCSMPWKSSAHVPFNVSHPTWCIHSMVHSRTPTTYAWSSFPVKAELLQQTSRPPRSISPSFRNLANVHLAWRAQGPVSLCLLQLACQNHLVHAVYSAVVPTQVHSFKTGRGICFA